jgi:hypothetical protein
MPIALMRNATLEFSPPSRHGQSREHGPPDAIEIRIAEGLEGARDGAGKHLHTLIFLG